MFYAYELCSMRSVSRTPLSKLAPRIFKGWVNFGYAFIEQGHVNTARESLA